MLPIELRLGAVLAALIAAWVGFHTWEQGLIHQGEQKQAQVQEVANANARLEQQRLANLDRQRQQEIVDAYRKQMVQESVASAGARRELDRLRIAAAASGGASAPGAGVAGGTDDARVIRGLLVEGAELAEEGRRRVGELAAKVTALQDAARVCAGQ